jgi:2-oxoglutarate ferredoxin oxidoreductase subunit beta
MLHLRQLERSIAEALVKPGFSFIEVISPCPPIYGRMNKRSRGLDEMHYYQEKSIVRNGADTKDVEIIADGPIIVGKFVDIQRPTFWDYRNMVLEKAREKKKL